MMHPLPIVLIVIAVAGMAQGLMTAIRRNRFRSPPCGREALLIGVSQCTGSFALLWLAVWQTLPALVFLVVTLVFRILLAHERKEERNSNIILERAFRKAASGSRKPSG